MADMSKFIEAKSDQLNSIDLIGGPITVKITKVKNAGGDQPVHVHYEGDNNKPWKPCKNMIRVMVAIWGLEGNDYVGKSITLFNDPKVKWAGVEQGGIRISHMSDIKGNQEKVRITIQESRGKSVNWLVKLLRIFIGNPLPPEHLARWKQEIEKATTMGELSEVATRIKEQDYEPKGKAEIMVHYKARSESIRNTETPSEPESLEGEDVAGL